ncbi:DUF4956 domain-containing protein [Glycomyces xiaoerkulensis]|uniref:DUF4956 domain-containing protein n=1 Tax=Glycomyces xiaoerkulensis TaxID=2038139 RepID=UPI000C25A2D3|nr:DUF4956 domain-containing protein [Glycomyces xiaoerkulensis]
MEAFGWTGLVADLALIAALVFGVYYRRHRRRHMVVPYIGINVGVYAVVTALLGAEIGIGVGIGLFGVLSIIRLRSDEISHGDVCYYFASLSIGLVCGIPLDPFWTGPALGLLVVAVMAVIDQPVWHQRYRQQRVVLERIYPSRPELEARLIEHLGAESITRIETTVTDLVRDSQTVDVTYRVAGPRDRSLRRRPVLAR